MLYLGNEFENFNLEIEKEVVDDNLPTKLASKVSAAIVKSVTINENVTHFLGASCLTENSSTTTFYTTSIRNRNSDIFTDDENKEHD
jgi:hypothetical protein